MRGTGSTRTATRCSWSRRLARAAGRAAAIAALGALGACVTRTTHAFTPDPNADRMSLADAQDALDRLVRLECPRLIAARHDTDEATVRVTLDGSGNVTRSTISKSSGDERMDRLFGGITAQMKFAAPPEGKEGTGRMRVGYSCSANAATATIHLVGEQ